MVRTFFERFDCPLCGDRHEPVFHSYPRRWVVDADGERQSVQVVTVACPRRKRTGRQATIRFLPPYLIPRSPLSCQRLCELLAGEREAIQPSNDAACEALGCVDPRTVRKHLCFVQSAVQAKLQVLAAVWAGAPVGSGEPPEFPPGTNALAILGLFWEAFVNSIAVLFGSHTGQAARALLWLSPGFQAVRVSIDRVFGPPPGGGITVAISP